MCPMLGMQSSTWDSFYVAVYQEKELKLFLYIYKSNLNIIRTIRK